MRMFFLAALHLLNTVAYESLAECFDCPGGVLTVRCPTLPCLEHVCVTDFLCDGPLGRKYCESICNNHRYEDRGVLRISLVPSCCENFETNKTCFPDLATYKAAVLFAISSMGEDTTDECVIRMRESVITSIHSAALKASTTTSEISQTTILTCFTAVALHNIYCFSHFPGASDYTESFGLLQLTGSVELERISKFCGRSKKYYCKHPYLLNNFTCDTIYDEYMYFCQAFMPSTFCSMRELLNSIIKAMAPQEAILLCDNTGASNACNQKDLQCLRAKLCRRFQIFDYLYLALIVKASSN